MMWTKICCRYSLYINHLIASQCKQYKYKSHIYMNNYIPWRCASSRYSIMIVFSIGITVIVYIQLFLEMHTLCYGRWRWSLFRIHSFESSARVAVRYEKIVWRALSKQNEIYITMEQYSQSESEKNISVKGVNLLHIHAIPW